MLLPNDEAVQQTNTKWIIINTTCLLISDLTLFPQPQPPLGGCRKLGKCPERKLRYN